MMVLAETRPANLPPAPGTQRAARRAAPDLPLGRALLHHCRLSCRRGCLLHEAHSPIVAAPTRGQALPSAITGCGRSCIAIPTEGEREARKIGTGLAQDQSCWNQTCEPPAFARNPARTAPGSASSPKGGRSCDIAASNVAGVPCTMKCSAHSSRHPPEVRRCPLPSRVAAGVASPSKPPGPCNVSIKPHLALNGLSAPDFARSPKTGFPCDAATPSLALALKKGEGKGGVGEVAGFRKGQLASSGGKTRCQLQDAGFLATPVFLHDVQALSGIGMVGGQCAEPDQQGGHHGL